MKVDLKIQGKKGPFQLKKLTYAQAQDFVINPAGVSESDLGLRLVQQTLVNGTGRPVYSPKQIPKMEEDLGGVKLLELVARAMEENSFSDMREFAATIDKAEKN